MCNKQGDIYKGLVLPEKQLVKLFFFQGRGLLSSRRGRRNGCERGRLHGLGTAVQEHKKRQGWVVEGEKIFKDAVKRKIMAVKGVGELVVKFKNDERKMWK